MKKLLMALCMVGALTLVAHADEPKDGKKKMTEEQKTLRKDMITKYDANKDGKLDKDEKAKMTTEEKEKWDKAFPRAGKKKDK